MWKEIKRGKNRRVFHMVNENIVKSSITGDYETAYQYRTREAGTLMKNIPGDGEFIYSHFPINPDYQLFASPLSKVDYFKTPDLGGRFFESIEKVSPYLDKVNRFGKKFDIEFTVKQDVLLLIYVYDQNGVTRFTDVVSVNKQDQVYTASFTLADKGKYRIRLYSRLPNDPEGGSYWSIIDYGVIVE
jgi:hypothetical protein